MALTGVLAGYNEQRAANDRSTAEADAIRRGIAAQILERQRLQQQQDQFSRELAARQQQQQQSSGLEQARLAQQAQQYAQTADLQRQEFGLKSKQQLGEMARQEQARNALRDMMASGEDVDIVGLGRALLPYDTGTGINLIKAGKEERRQQALMDRTGGTGVQPPQGYRWTREGNLEAIPGGSADPRVLAQLEGIKSGAKGPKALTETQGNATAFGMRAAKSDDIMNALEDKGVMTGSLIKQGLESIPLVGGALGMAANAFVASPEQQQVDQAQRDFISAVLRKESGAAISPSEFENARKQYFPQPGESKEVREQKRANRETAIEALRVQAGPGADYIPKGKASQEFNSLPDPRQHKGKTIRDTETGARWTSNGRDWTRAP